VFTASEIGLRPELDGLVGDDTVDGMLAQLSVPRAALRA
jgi:hypothetical protein